MTFLQGTDGVPGTPGLDGRPGDVGSVGPPVRLWHVTCYAVHRQQHVSRCV